MVLIRNAGPVAQHLVVTELEVHFPLPGQSFETRPMRLVHHRYGPTSTWKLPALSGPLNAFEAIFGAPSFSSLRSTKITEARVAVHVKGAGAIGYGVPAGEDQIWWSGKLGDNFAHKNLHSGRVIKLDSLPGEGGDRVDPLEQVTEEFAILPHTAHQGKDLL